MGKNSISSIIIGMLLVASLLGNLVLWDAIRHQKQTKEFPEMDYFQTKRMADSLLHSGQYAEALVLYQQLDSLRPAHLSEQLDSVMIFTLQENEQLKKIEKDFLALNRDNANLKADSLNLQYQNSQQVRHLVGQIDSLKIMHSIQLNNLEEAEREINQLKFQQLNREKAVSIKSFTNPDGIEVKYIGHTINDKAEGFGYAVFDKKGFYEGHWHNNLRDGDGKYYWTNGDIYEGQYRKGQRNGEGTYFFHSGEKYVGQWQNDLRHGEGKIFNKDGKETVSGVWEKDELIKN
ncbi:MORN repeat-containing protein [Persicobacter sp. CCB-QB2]|uniref:MORN repeat-containing protein n=1 Tax=Persicobacter sp. CCB-QB2 TaxID=1561025 RepID=UPI0006A9F095|nr:hypothetical protein [Persicobacter sp. CCB-QB2]